MAVLDRAALKAYVDANINTNGANAITGAIHNQALNDVIDSLLNLTDDAALIGGLSEYDTGTSYTSGQLTIYQGTIYQARVTATGAFDPAKWDVITHLKSSAYAFDQWDNGTTYALNDIKRIGGKAFISIQAGNQGNPPESSPAFWTELTTNNGHFGNDYVNGLYLLGHVVRDDGQLWKLNVASLNSTDIIAEIEAGDWLPYLEDAGDGAAWQEEVISTVADPSTLTPSIDERWLIAASGVGVWLNRDGQIAEWRGSKWKYTQPTDGMVVKILDDDDGLWIHEGTYTAGVFAWVEFTGGGGGGTPGGADTQVQFNDAGAFGGDSDLVWNKTTNTLTINGALNALTKSFDIPHPTEEGRLVYGSLEGPEFGVYYRGKGNGTGVIDLPDYWRELIDYNTITVQLTPIGNAAGLYVEDIKDNEIFIGGGVNYYFIVHAERKDINKLEVEQFD